MRINSSTRYATLAALVGALACAGNGAQGTMSLARRRTRPIPIPRANGTDENPPGYSGMERDTTQVPPSGQTASDTFLQNQGTGTPQDTAGYSGIER